jgi:hypothetical protein
VLWCTPIRSRKKMNSRLDSFWYAIQHPLGPSRELGSYANHQKSVEKLIREMTARATVDDEGERGPQ